MLNIYFGDMSDVIYNTNIYFNNTYKDSWITKPLSKEIIKAVDKSEVKDEKTILSPIFGNISPRKLSSGVKTLLLIAYDKSKIFNASTCGDNCAEWILKIAGMKEEQHQKVVINLRHLMDFGTGEFKIKIMNTGKIVENMGDLVSEAGEFVWGRYNKDTSYWSDKQRRFFMLDVFRNITIVCSDSGTWEIKLYDIEDILNDPFDHVESAEYFSWEYLFEKYNIDATVDIPF